MKKIICAVLSLILVISFAYAKDINANIAPRCSEFLDKMVFCEFLRGTDKGLELEKSLTRAEAAALINRIIGGEYEATVKSHTHPFTDVPDWANADVGYIYEKKFINGVSDTLFAPQRAVSAQEFYAMLLRVLGYSEKNGDFSFKEVLSFSQKIGLLSADEADAVSKGFTRDGATVAMYNALITVPKGEKMPLCKIVASDINASYSIVCADVLLGTSDTYNVLSTAIRNMDNLKNYTLTQDGTYITKYSSDNRQANETYSCTVLTDLVTDTAIYETSLETSVNNKTETLKQTLFSNKNGAYMEAKTESGPAQYSQLAKDKNEHAHSLALVHRLFAPDANFVTNFDCTETETSYILKGFNNRYNLLYDITSNVTCDYFYDMTVTIDKETMLISSAEVTYSDIWHKDDETVNVDYKVKFEFRDINSTDVSSVAEKLEFIPIEI